MIAAGCAGHAASTEAARSALDAGATTTALALLNKQLGVERAEDVPEDIDSAKTLYLLDRSMVLAQLQRFPLVSRDLELADKQLMMLDFSRGAASDLGKYLFSDDTGPYRAPGYEKLLVNTLNMAAYLARGDLNGARVEARRFAVLEKALKDAGSAQPQLLGPGAYLAGFVFEKSGRADEALRYYAQAADATRFETLGPALRELARSGQTLPASLAKLADAAPDAPAPGAPKEPTAKAPDAGDAAAAASPAEPATGEVLVILCYGRVPPKIAERLPIGLALTYASGAMSPNDVGRANSLAAQGLVTWVNYPRLGNPRGTWQDPGLSYGGQWVALDGALAVDQAAKTAWDAVRGRVVASAITRMIARVVAGETVRRATNDSLLGLLLSLGTQATMTAMDTPDTRSWSTLPARIALSRLRLPAGKHQIVVDLAGHRSTHEITLAPGGWSTLWLTELR